MRLALAMLLAFHCGPSLPLAASDWTTAQEAAALLGLPVEPGLAVQVEWSKRALTTDREGCRRKVESPREPVMLAHELGHALGLEHVEDPANVMHLFVGADTTEVTTEQHDAMWRELEQLRGCP